MTTFYQKDQLKKVAKLIRPEVPGWLLLGGPADGNEAQCAVACWPGVRVLAVEPNAAAVNFQRANGFPGPEPEHWLLDGALTDYSGYCCVRGGENLRSARVVHEDDDGAHVCWKLDSLDQTHGPFERALLWLDVEGSELRAIEGAAQLLASGRVWWVTVETSDHDLKQRAEVNRFLATFGFGDQKVWSTTKKYEDTLWRLKDAKRS